MLGREQRDHRGGPKPGLGPGEWALGHDAGAPPPHGERTITGAWMHPVAPPAPPAVPGAPAMPNPPAPPRASSPRALGGPAPGYDRKHDRVFARLHSHARGLVIPCLILIAAGGFIGYSMRGLREGGSWLTWAWLVGIAAVLLGLVPILAWLRNRVVITRFATRRFRGLVRSNRVELPHHHVTDVQVRRNAWQAIFGSGTVVLTGFDGRRLELFDVPNAVTVAQALRELGGVPDRSEGRPPRG